MKVFQASDTGSTRTVAWANPLINNNDCRLELMLSKGLQQNVGGVYELMPEFTRKDYAGATISNDMLVHAETGAIYPGPASDAPDGYVPGWLWVIGTRLGDLTETPSAEDYVFGLIAARIEMFLTVNNLWGEEA